MKTIKLTQDEWIEILDIMDHRDNLLKEIAVIQSEVDQIDEDLYDFYESKREPTSIEKVYDEQSVESMFLSRLNSVSDSVKFHSPKVIKWDEEKDLLLQSMVLEGHNIDDMIELFIDMGYCNTDCRGSILSRLYKIGYRKPLGSSVWIRK